MAVTVEMPTLMPRLRDDDMLSSPRSPAAGRVKGLPMPYNTHTQFIQEVVALF